MSKEVINTEGEIRPPADSRLNDAFEEMGRKVLGILNTGGTTENVEGAVESEEQLPLVKVLETPKQES